MTTTSRAIILYSRIISIVNFVTIKKVRAIYTCIETGTKFPQSKKKKKNMRDVCWFRGKKRTRIDLAENACIVSARGRVIDTWPRPKEARKYAPTFQEMARKGFRFHSNSFVYVESLFFIVNTSAHRTKYFINKPQFIAINLFSRIGQKISPISHFCEV